MPVIARCSTYGLFVSSCLIAVATASTSGRGEFYPGLCSYMEQRETEFDRIPAGRKHQLREIALYVKGRAKANLPSRLTFICTHNSRRSQMSQVWAAAAANFYGIGGIETFSGGTEVSAVNPRAIRALMRAGWKVEKTEDGKNPHYDVRFKETDKALICFSKVCDEAPNPKDDFCAVMTCSQADKNCPTVVGSTVRFAIPFEDSNVSDGHPEEDERCQQIAREMLYLFSQVSN